MDIHLIHLGGSSHPHPHSWISLKGIQGYESQVRTSPRFKGLSFPLLRKILKDDLGREKGMRAEILSELGAASAIVFEIFIHLLQTGI